MCRLIYDGYQIIKARSIATVVIVVVVVVEAALVVAVVVKRMRKMTVRNRKRPGGWSGVGAGIPSVSRRLKFTDSQSNTA